MPNDAEFEILALLYLYPAGLSLTEIANQLDRAETELAPVLTGLVDTGVLRLENGDYIY